MEMTQEILVSNLAKYKKKLSEYLGEEIVENIVDSIGGDEVLMEAAFAQKEDSGMAYTGSLIKSIFEITTYAVKLNSLLPENKQAKKNSIVKVCMLQHIAKAVMLVKNDDDWEVKKRGIFNKFADIPGSLRSGERSILICVNNGVKFSDEEFEAMRICDAKDDDTYNKVFCTVLSLVIRQANELVTKINTKKQ